MLISRILKNRTPVFRDSSPDAYRGGVIAAAVPIDAGKPSIVNLIRRFHDIDSGRITVCNADHIRAFNGGQIVKQRAGSRLLAQRGVCAPPYVSHNKGHQA